VTIPLPWERLLWSARPTPLLPRLHLHGERYALTDMRVVRISRTGVDELATSDIGEVHRTQTPLERILGVSTLHIRHRETSQTLVIRGVRRASQLAALIDLLATDPRARANVGAALAVMTWEPKMRTPGARGSLAGIAAAASAAVIVFGIVTGLHGTSAPISYPADDAIYPGGRKRDHDEIVRFMEKRVMPWARQALAPIVGAPGLVTCHTCHGADAGSATGWHMPAVAALPRPAVRVAGWENYGGAMDDQMRNAIYGYGAESDRASRAAYMREVVMPGMAQLLGRPAYDFTQPYAFNRSHFAFGCYHCHKVKQGS
jgi:cytochrome c553